MAKIYKVVDGVQIGLEFNEQNLRSAFHYKAVPGDIFIATYPKCGTTWMQHIVNEILTMTSPSDDDVTRALRFPYLDFLGAEGAEKMIRPGCIKTHLSFDRIPFSDDAKYIYVARNPYDCCVSYYYHYQSRMSRLNDDSLETFLDLFLKGEVPYGGYFEHLLPWYEHRNKPNVFFLTYEDLKKDPRFWILKIADFIGQDYGRELRGNPTLLDKVLDAVSVDGMKKSFSADFLKILRILLELPPERAIKSLELYEGLREKLATVTEVASFVRKGEIGDSRSHFTQHQILRLKEWILTKTEHSDVVKIWDEVDLL